MVDDGRWWSGFLGNDDKKIVSADIRSRKSSMPTIDTKGMVNQVSPGFRDYFLVLDFGFLFLNLSDFWFSLQDLSPFWFWILFLFLHLFVICVFLFSFLAF